MRDQSGKSNIQVTVLNDRAQAGTADLTDKATIELMQNRMTLQDDKKGLDDPLNDTDIEGYGFRVNAKYYIQIFDTTKANSAQRDKQLNLEAPLQYFFAPAFQQNKDKKASAQSSKLSTNSWLLGASNP